MKISAAQADASLVGSENRLLWLEEKVKLDAGNNADLVIFPELFMTSYNFSEASHRYAKTQDGPFAQRVGILAKGLSISAAYGYPESGDDKVYNAFVLSTVMARH